VIAADDQGEVAGLQSPAHHLVGFPDSPVGVVVAQGDVTEIAHLHG
jgi:hypothetical protein